MPRVFTICALFACFTAFSPERQFAVADDPAPGFPQSLSLPDLNGTVHDFGPAADRTALVFVLMSTECPISNSYLPQLNQFYKEWSAAEQRIDVLGFISDAGVSRTEAAAHSAEYKIDFPVVFDGSAELARHLQPTHTPEAFVLDAQGKIVYRGRIDNLYADLGKRRRDATTHELKDAVAALIAGKHVETKYEKPIGCLFEPRRTSDEEARVTFNRDIAPIIYANCTGCHRDGEVAPFPLVTFEDVSKRSRQILTVIEKGLMPPWRPAPGIGHFLGERRLSNRQKELLKLWSKSGAPEGDPDDRTNPPVFKSGWKLGEPDLVLKMPQAFTIPADGPDIFQNFVLPLNIEKDHFVIAAEFKPGNSRVVHHTIFYLDKNGAARKLDERDPQPGYSTFGGPGFLPTGAVGGWSPGTTPRILPGGYCRYAAAGSDLVLQIHYHPTGKEETDQSEVGLYFRERPKNIVANVTLSNFGFKIKAGETDHVVKGSYTLPEDVSLVGLTPHMHLLGRRMRVTADYPDGNSEDLIWIKDWNFYWQDQYYLQSPKRLPKGTTLRLEARYDNSADNPFNPNSPPRDVTFGEETTDEMCFCFCLVATDSPYDLRPVIIDNVRQVATKRLRSGLRQFEFLKP